MTQNALSWVMEHLLTIWPSQKALAADLGVPVPTVGSWAQRGIPARRFMEIIAAAKSRGVLLEFETLAAVAGPKVSDHAEKENAA